MIRLCAALAVAAGAPVALGQAPIIEFRIRERHGDVTVGAPGDFNPRTSTPAAEGDASDATLWFVVEAMLKGGPDSVRGMSVVLGSLDIVSGSGRGRFKTTAAGWNASPSWGPGAFWFPDTPPLYDGALGHRGLFGPYRRIADLSEQATGLVSLQGIDQIYGSTGGAPFNALADGDVGEAAFARDAWVPVYTFQYDVTSNVPRTLTFATNFQSAAFTTWDINNVPDTVNATVVQGAYSVAITDVPAPAAVTALLFAAAGIRPSRYRGARAFRSRVEPHA